VTTFQFTSTPDWQGRPVARTAGAAEARQRAVVTGTVISAGEVKTGDIVSYQCLIDDGTGTLGALFLGRRVAGMAIGRRCTVEGTVQAVGGEKVIWNPLFQVEADDP
jgi:predicted thioesterase